MGSELKVTTQRGGEDGPIELAAVGELDLTTIGRFESELQAAVAQAGPGGTTTLDLRGVEYLDSATINVLFANAERISLVRVNPMLLRALTISGLDQVVAVQAAGPD